MPLFPKPGDDAPERLGALVEVRAAGVVLEARQRPRLRRLELALEEDVADHPPLAGDGVVGEEADPGELRAERSR